MHGSPPADSGPERFEPDALAALPPELALARLPVGRHGLPRSFVDDNQRLRLIAAMLRVLPRHGYPGTTIGHVTREAGVSRSAFYAQFESKEVCLLATYDLAAGWLCERVDRAAGEVEVQSAVSEAGIWPLCVRAGVAEALRLLAANPDLAQLIAVEALQAGPVARRRRQACIAHFAGALRAGRPRAAELPDDLEELLVGGALAHVTRYIEDDRADRLPEATAELVHCLLAPYLDPAESRRIAAQAA